MDKVLDELRDAMIGKDLRSVFIKYTECDSEQCDKAVMVFEQFAKCLKGALGDKYLGREVESIFRVIVAKKPLTLSRFLKLCR